MFRDKDIRGKKKKCRKKNRLKCKSNKSVGQTEPGLAANGSSLDKDAVHCQYLMAESFVKSILEWKCPIPRDEFKDIADVMLKRLGSILEYSPSNGEDRKSQQMRFLADVIASWISGVLFEVAEARKTELEEECERRRKAIEEETEEDSEDESEESDDDDDEEGPKGGGGPRRKGEEDKRKKGGDDGKDEDDDEKPGRPVRREDVEEAPEADALKDPAEEVTEDRPSKSEPAATEPQEEARESKEEETFHDARTEPGSPADGDEKKPLARKAEETRRAEEEVGDGSMINAEIGEKKDDQAQDEVPKDSPVEKYDEAEEPLARVEAVLEPEKSRDLAEDESEIGRQQDEGLFEKSVEASQFADHKTARVSDEVKTADAFVDHAQPLAEDESEIGKQQDEGLFEKSVEASQFAEHKTARVSDEVKTADAFVDHAQPLAEAKERTGREPMEIGEAAQPTTITASPAEAGPMAETEITGVSKSEKVVVAGVPDDRAAGDKIDDREIARKQTKIPEVAEALEAEKDARAPIVPADGGDAGTEAQKEAFMEEEETKKAIAPSKDPSESARAEESMEKVTDREEHDEPKVIKLFEDPSRLAPDGDLEETETESKRADETKKVLEPKEDPSAVVTIESLKDKRREPGKKRPSKVPSSPKALIGKKYETDAPFVTFDKIFHTIYNAIEASKENPGGDSITNRIHRAVYEKFANVVREENPGPLADLTRDVLDVMSGKIALWLRDVLTDSQLSFVNKFPATVESVEVREWNDWIGNVFDTANTWSAWIQRTIRQAEGMRTHEVTRGDWRDWTRSVETDALRWRRFYLESVHRAHQNLTMMRDRHVVKTGARNADEKKGEYEEEMKITDLENLTMMRDRHVVKTGARNADEKKGEYEEEMKITDLEVER